MDLVAAFVIGFVAAAVGAIAAGGGLISIPGLIFLGATPVSAIATSRLNLMAGGLSAIYRYRKDGAVIWKYIPHFFSLAIIAGVVGPKLLLGIDENTVARLVGVMLLMMLPVVWLHKDAGTIRVLRSRHRTAMGYPVIALLLIYLTVFGGGAGIFIIYAFVYFFGMTVTEANATGYVIALIATFVALIAYSHAGAVDWSLGIPLMTGGLIGGYVGAHIALKQGAKWVKAVLTVVILACGIKLSFFS